MQTSGEASPLLHPLDMSADDEVYPSRVPIFRDVEKGMKNCFYRKGKKRRRPQEHQEYLYMFM